MTKVTLGRTGITVNRNGFGALPIQRVSREEAAAILRRAYEAGVDFYDTAHMYSDSEEKLGYALHDVRDNIVIATKSGETTPEGIRADVEESLRRLRTDHVDILQLHNPPFCPKPGDGSGIYELLLRLREEGKVRFLSFTNHRLAVAREAVESGLYDTLQFPFSYLASPADTALVELCREKNVGFIAMKALSGGLITNSAAAYAFLAQYDNVLPIWGIQRLSELEEFLSYQESPPTLDGPLSRVIEADRAALGGSFCRGCGYCMPCPAGIEINSCARMSLFLRRSPTANWLGERGQAMMKKIEGCLECGQCKSRCPYGLDTPRLLKKNYEDYKTFLTE